MSDYDDVVLNALINLVPLREQSLLDGKYLTLLVFLTRVLLQEVFQFLQIGPDDTLHGCSVLAIIQRPGPRGTNLKERLGMGKLKVVVVLLLHVQSVH